MGPAPDPPRQPISALPGRHRCWPWPQPGLRWTPQPPRPLDGLVAVPGWVQDAWEVQGQEGKDC